jgi:Domain of unknown function (DUF5753)
VVAGEAALRQVTGGRTVMRGQLATLATVNTSLPHVSVRYLGLLPCSLELGWRWSDSEREGTNPLPGGGDGFDQRASSRGDLECPAVPAADEAGACIERLEDLRLCFGGISARSQMEAS